jgi:hypothetical protein
MRHQVVISSLAIALLGAVAAVAQDGEASTRLRGFEEVPALQSPGGGTFAAEIVGNEVHWELNYFNVKGNVTQSHIHFGQHGVNGGISVFLCSNLGNGPAGTQLCPNTDGLDAGTVSGTFTADDVIGPTSQGIGPGNFAALLRAMRAGIAYANVHTDIFPGGEIRGQLKFTPAP